MVGVAPALAAGYGLSYPDRTSWAGHLRTLAYGAIGGSFEGLVVSLASEGDRPLDHILLGGAWGTGIGLITAAVGPAFQVGLFPSVRRSSGGGVESPTPERNIMGWWKASLKLAMLSTAGLLAGCEEAGLDCGSVTTIPAAECEALLTIYNATDGGRWTKKAGWLLSADPCVWLGVSCSDEQVVQLRLTSNKLTGSIPVEVGNLTALTFLDLSGNQLSGPIPTELGNLAALNNLVLSRNNLTGSIPAELGNLTALRSLRLGRNQFSGAIPTELGNLTNLEVLFMHTNQLTGLVPLPVAGLGGELQEISSDRCSFVSNPDLYMPGSQDYMDADHDDDGSICGVALSTQPEEIAASLESDRVTFASFGP